VSRIVIVGGYGAFGAHAAERLAGHPGLDIVIAGRTPAKARARAATLAAAAGTRIEHARFDAAHATAAELRALAPTVLINASGPFQDQDYGLARACIAAGCHYVDLADARAFVTGIVGLDEQARAANVAVIAGASSVPGLSSAVVQHLAADLAHIDTIDIGISPGNSFEPGLATVRSIVGAVGQPFTLRAQGRPATAHGWQGLHRHRFPAIGTRWMCDVDVPDLDLLPLRYPELSAVRFSAGLEVGAFHLGLWTMSWLARAGVLRDLSPLAGPLLAIKRRLSSLGSDAGGMFVRLGGRDAKGTKRTRIWHLIARSGHGPYVPAIASVILAKQLATGSGPAPGARPCVGLFTLSDFLSEVADLDIACTIDRVAAD
jgi:hypothetical protein